MQTENIIQNSIDGKCPGSKGLAILCILLAFLIGMPLTGVAANLNDSVLEIPEGTVFKLRYELEIPANRDYIILGQSVLDEGFNSLHQTLNRNTGRYYGYESYIGGYKHFSDYHAELFEGFGRTYRKCRERHRQYYRTGGSSSDSVIINNGNGNTNIIVNNNVYEPYSYGSYIGSNTCVRPDHTVTALLIDSDASGSGGAFRGGHEFRVESVSKRSTRSYDILMINFDHDVANGIAIVTTHDLNDIAIHQLQYSEQEGSKGFWAGFADALGGLSNIAGIHFDVNLPEGKRYFD